MMKSPLKLIIYIHISKKKKKKKEKTISILNKVLDKDKKKFC
ncbi:hypothetical protein Calkro_2149 [Caldicellulosiruptor kronotskyensis 2002]|uniref:Uncharacterized protein n=1 Tax=Caldicellulosiruptor kronotskyensis (strain DSM 18902 / VKM B-2412 / 2002) TaxID=632348 RepID=E4SGW5_CALK2|nr:hypothetical protein Calkro_2149 [Caldicellulosiruptor kronotskyensis 2002]